MKFSSYMDRAMRARDPRFAIILGSLGYRRSDLAAHPLDHDKDGKKGGSTGAKQTDDLGALRGEYQEALGKRPFNGWDAAELRKRIEAVKSE